MAWVARIPPAAGCRLVLSGVLALAACTGTEHVVFIPFDPPVTLPPQQPADGSAPPADAAPPTPKDAEVPDEDAGPGPRRGPDLDPTITFQWKETLPGQGTCRAGQYVGSFTCTVPPPSDASLAPSFPISGQVVFTLATSSEQQLLAVTDGAIKDAFGFNTAGLQGSLRCADKAFAAVTVDGLSWLPFGGFEATLAGSFDDQALVIDGEFEMTNSSGERCLGDFHVSAAP